MELKLTKRTLTSLNKRSTEIKRQIANDVNQSSKLETSGEYYPPLTVGCSKGTCTGACVGSCKGGCQTGCRGILYSY